MNSLNNADYNGDTVNLEVFVDFPTDGPTPEQDAVVRYVTYSLKWPHGAVTKNIRKEKGGIVKQWIHPFQPSQPGNVVLILEDDIEVSPLYYSWTKAAVDHYYLDCSNYHSSIIGLSLERQHETLGDGRLFWLIEKYPDIITQRHEGSGAVYATQKDSSWAPIVFPETWNGFVDWFWSEGVNLEPCIYGLYSNKWHTDTPGNIWTPWLHKYIFDNGLFFLYFNYGELPHEWVPNALVRNHRETGLHFNKTTKAKARWQPFVEHEPPRSEFRATKDLVVTDFYTKKVQDPGSLVDRWRLLSNVDNPCHYFQ